MGPTSNLLYFGLFLWSLVRLRERAERQHLGDGAAGSCPHRGGDGDRDVTHQSLTKAWKSPEKPMAGGSRWGSSCSTFVSTSKSVLQFWYGNCPVANSTCRGDSGGQRCHHGEGGMGGHRAVVGGHSGEVGWDTEGVWGHRDRGQRERGGNGDRGALGMAMGKGGHHYEDSGGGTWWGHSRDVVAHMGTAGRWWGHSRDTVAHMGTAGTRRGHGGDTGGTRRGQGGDTPGLTREMPRLQTSARMS